MELHFPAFELITQAAAQSVELLHNQCVTWPQSLKAAGEGRPFCRGVSKTFVLEDGPAPDALQRRKLQRRLLILGQDVRLAVFHARILAQQNGTAQALFLKVPTSEAQPRPVRVCGFSYSFSSRRLAARLRDLDYIFPFP
jgi:hypothetical protein